MVQSRVVILLAPILVALFAQGCGGGGQSAERTVKATRAAGPSVVAALLKKDFDVSGRCVKAKLTPGTYWCKVNLSRLGQTRLGVTVSNSGDSVNIISCEPAAKTKPNEAVFCALKRRRG